MAISYVYVGQMCSQCFSVVDRNTELLVGGVDSTDFDVDIFDPNGYNRVSGPSEVDWLITEKFPDSGYYKFEFLPDTTGDWLVSIKHEEYFPWGKSADYAVVNKGYYVSDSTVAGGEAILDMLDDILVYILSDM
jgi:hypothetical protein